MKLPATAFPGFRLPPPGPSMPAACHPTAGHVLGLWQVGARDPAAWPLELKPWASTISVGPMAVWDGCGSAVARLWGDPCPGSDVLGLFDRFAQCSLQRLFSSTLRRSQPALARIIASDADPETGGDFGFEWLLLPHCDRARLTTTLLPLRPGLPRQATALRLTGLRLTLTAALLPKLACLAFTSH